MKPTIQKINSNFTDHLYHKIEHARDVFFRQVAEQLSRLKITANIVTALGVVMMVFFVFLVPHSLILGLSCLLASVLLDGIDGVLARFQNTASDKGKLLDVMADNFCSFLFALGLSQAGLINPILMIAYIYFMLLAKVFKIYLNSFNYQSDWLFRAVAGFVSNFINYIAYFLFALCTFYPLHLNPPFLVMTIILFIYCIWHFIRIIQMSSPKCDINNIK